MVKSRENPIYRDSINESFSFGDIIGINLLLGPLLFICFTMSYLGCKSHELRQKICSEFPSDIRVS